MSKIDAASQEARIQAATKRALEAERDSNDRIREAEKRAQMAEVDAEDKIQQTRDRLDQDIVELTHRKSVAMEAERSKGYEELGRVKRETGNLLQDARTEAERELKKLRENYEDQTYLTERDGQAKLRETQKRSSNELETSGKQVLQALETQRVEGNRRQEAISAYFNQKQQELEKFKNEELAKIDVATQNTLAEGKIRRNQQIAEVTKAYEASLAAIQQKTASELNLLRENHATKISDYSNRLQDPFYQLAGYQALLEEVDDAYILVAKIPEHERDHVNVSVNGPKILLSGRRAHADGTEIEEGRRRETQSFQTLREIFTVKAPIAEREITQTFDGDKLVVVLPKLRALEIRNTVKKPSRTAIERPDFPNNIPDLKAESRSVRQKQINDNVEAQVQSPNTRRTLSPS